MATTSPDFFYQNKLCTIATNHGRFYVDFTIINGYYVIIIHTIIIWNNFENKILSIFAKLMIYTREIKKNIRIIFIKLS